MHAQHTLTGAELLIRVLQLHRVEVIFGYPGGAVLPIYDELFKQNAIRHILVRHEQGAVHAAEGYARSTGKPGIVLVTSGPGATNAVTGLADALMDSVPIVCLTGQVPTHLIGNDAFQECDTTGITRPCTKHNWLVRKVSGLEQTLHEAFHVATHGRPGPVVVDIPKDVQFAQTVMKSPDKPIIGHPTYHPQTKPDPHLLDEAVRMIMQAKRPVIYAGGGVINAGHQACARLDQLVKLTNWPITLTLMGLGAIPASRPQFLGMLGMHGSFEANMTMHGCDAMLAIGARFDDRITGRVDAFSPDSKKIQIDIDAASVNKNIAVDLAIIGDANLCLAGLLERLQGHSDHFASASIDPWWACIDEWRARDSLSYAANSAVIKPQQAIRRLWERTQDKDVYITTEVGQHQMWAAQHFMFEKPFHWMTSGGLGTMGYGLPAAIGVQLGHPEALVVDIAGEASILMNMQELSTACQFNLPVKIFILNNQYMGMVRQWQELLHGGRYSQSYSEALPDFVKLAEAYGATGVRATTHSELDHAIDVMIETKGPVLADIAVDPNENCFPMIPSGAAHNEMILGDEENGTKPGVSSEGKVLV
ncbi:MAG: acetolactate synthase 3 large subunit [Pseudomonadota bacterium]